jgi:hypothetical protein
MIGFNGTGLMLAPTSAGWVTQDSLGIGGNGVAIYPRLREFQMTFNLESQQEFYELLTYFSIMATGTVVARLPDFRGSVFGYKDYSGTILRQPEFTEYFAEEYLTEVKLVLLVQA